MEKDGKLIQSLDRIADALDRMAPKKPSNFDTADSDAFIWEEDGKWLRPIQSINRIEIHLLLGIDYQAQLLMKNTEQFAAGFSANNALLWGARGTGKSSLVKAIHGSINEKASLSLILVEIHREDIKSLSQLLAILREHPSRFLLFCDDLSFDTNDDTYKSLKGLLEGGIEGRPENVLFYATSNRRHLMARDMVDNERSTAIHSSESVEEKVSLSDRFGLWLGFHNCDQNTFFAIVEQYAKSFGLNDPTIDLRSEANEWAITRGSRSGRVAWQYIQDLAGRLGKKIS